MRRMRVICPRCGQRMDVLKDVRSDDYTTSTSLHVCKACGITVVEINGDFAVCESQPKQEEVKVEFHDE